jgi:hypothetical protein
MKNMVLAAAFATFVGNTVAAGGFELEKDATLGSGMDNLALDARAELIAAAVTLVRAAGYRCDTISYFGRRSAFSSGFQLSCNRYLYGYSLRDVGGNWIVEVE